MAKGRFNIHGTKDFLVMAVFCGFLCIWSIRDAWFPTEKILKKHPREIEVSFKVSGVVKNISVKPGDEIKGETALASLSDEAYRAKVTEAEAVFEAAKTKKDTTVEAKLDSLMKARADLAACTVKNTDFTWKTTHGEEVLRGTICRILVENATHVEVGAPIMTITPVDTFYQFNKTLSVLSFVGLIAALIFHRVASR
jgi:multidrug resistance efflux pump